MATGIPNGRLGQAPLFALPAHAGRCSCAKRRCLTARRQHNYVRDLVPAMRRTKQTQRQTGSARSHPATMWQAGSGHESGFPRPWRHARVGRYAQQQHVSALAGGEGIVAGRRSKHLPRIPCLPAVVSRCAKCRRQSARRSGHLLTDAGTALTGHAARLRAVR